MAKLVLDELAMGMPALTPANGQMLAEAASVCLDAQQHANPTLLSVNPPTPTPYHLVWLSVTQQMRDGYNDLDEAVEFGACGIAVLLMKDLFALTVVKRSRKHTGFDYWLGKSTFNTNTDYFNATARLEVSGILKEHGSNTVRYRLKEKERQSTQSDFSGLPAFIVVVEFDGPQIGFIKRWPR